MRILHAHVSVATLHINVTTDDVTFLLHVWLSSILNKWHCYCHKAMQKSYRRLTVRSQEEILPHSNPTVGFYSPNEHSLYSQPVSQLWIITSTVTDNGLCPRWFKNYLKSRYSVVVRNIRRLNSTWGESRSEWNCLWLNDILRKCYKFIQVHSDGLSGVWALIKLPFIQKAHTAESVNTQ